MAVGLQHGHLAHGKDAFFPVCIHFRGAEAAAFLLVEGVAMVCRMTKRKVGNGIEKRAKRGGLAFKALAADSEEDAGHLLASVTAVPAVS